MIHRRLPGGRPDLALGRGEVGGPVEVPGDRLVARVGPVDDDGVGVVAGLAAGARLQAAAQAGGLVTGTAGIDAAMQGPGVLRQRVDVLHDVDLAGGRPVGAGHRPGRAGSAGPEPGPQHPERRPVAKAAGRIGLFDRGADLELATGRGGEVGGGRLDPARGPACAGLHRGDVQVAAAVLGHVRGRVRIALDLTGAPVGGTSAAVVLGAGVVGPLRVHV